MPSCGVCPSVLLSVCLSVTFVHSVKMSDCIINFFSPSGGYTILVFIRHTSWRYCDGNLLTGASNAGGVGKNRDLSRYLAPSRAVSTSTAKCNTHTAATDRGKLMTIVAGKRRSLLMAGDDDKLFMTRSLNGTPKTTEQDLIVRIVVNLKPK